MIPVPHFFYSGVDRMTGKSFFAYGYAAIGAVLLWVSSFETARSTSHLFCVPIDKQRRFWPQDCSRLSLHLYTIEKREGFFCGWAPLFWSLYAHFR